jgi:hypothetical protein
MIVALTFVPLWIVLWRRVQAGRWTELSPADLNAAWTPPPAVEPAPVVSILPHGQIGSRAKTVWLALGACGLVACIAALVTHTSNGPFGTLSIDRGKAADVATRAVPPAVAAHTTAAAGESGSPSATRWRVMPVPDDGSGGPHELVAETAGETRWRELLGIYLPAPRWRVRVATFEGDVVDRAEEWHVYVSRSGEVRSVQHLLPEGRAGASLDETAARRLATASVAERLGLDASRGQIREVSASPSKLKARTDWTFTFQDMTVAPLPQGEARIDVYLAGDEVAWMPRYIFVPEDWQRKQRAAATRNLILQILETLVFAALIASAAVLGVIAWSRRQFTPRLFLAGGGLMLLVSMAKSANAWPTAMASMMTAAPLAIQVAGLIAISLVGLVLNAALVGLALGALPHRLSGSGSLPDRDALYLGLSAGFAGAAAATAATWLRTPVWARFPDITAAGTVVPILQTAVNPITRLLMASAILLVTLAGIEGLTSGWTRRRALGILAVAAIGFLAGGVPPGTGSAGWLMSGAILAVALIVVYATLLRFDLTLVPLAVATMTAVSALGRGAERAYPGALAGAVAAAILLMTFGWWWFKALRRARAAAAPQTQASTAT